VHPGLELCWNGLNRGPPAQKAMIMSEPPQNDGRATASARFHIFNRRPGAGMRWAGRAFQSLVAAAQDRR